MSTVGMMEELPPECLSLVISHLTKAKDVIHCMQVSRRMSRLAGSEVIWRTLTFHDFGVYDDEPTARLTAAITSEVELAAGDARRGRQWRRLYAAVYSQLARKTRVLRVHGLFTDGGVDENDLNRSS
mmetsp:Transcript_17495/g.43350  ORF Transcript_17495/g.43350 Transcript_17495/m.43350 type:complete len:127 (-) Transcript_17495:85-465(-)